MTDLSEIRGTSASIVALRDHVARLVDRVAGLRRLPPVLVLGETGTGKTLLAKALHRAGPRARGPFVDVNCAAIAENLLESEMFGHERGAFTDARTAKPGLFQTAHGGTLFLDEIGELPEKLQVKLLKALEDGVVRRVGGTRNEPADVWVLAATNADLELAMREGRFRADLYHRLAAFVLTMPPLRDRGDDIVTLAEHFIAQQCREAGLPEKVLSAEARAALVGYAWPGNIREMENLFMRVVALCDGERLDAAALGLPLPSDAATPTTGAPEPALTLEETMGRVERHHVLETLERLGWNVTRAAEALSISRDTLRYRIEKHGLQRGQTPRGARSRARTPKVSPAATTNVPHAVVPAPPRRAAGAAPRRVALLRIAVDPGTPGGADALIEKVEVFGGRIEEIGASGLLASFGVDAVEDAVRRAAHAALAIRSDQSLRYRTAIHVSMATVIDAVRGVQIDLDAKRAMWQTIEDLIAIAEPGTTIVSDAAVPFMLRVFELVPVETGVPDGRVYRLTGRERSGFAVGRHESRFVGRQGELDALLSALHGAVAGHGQPIGIVGDAGIGKSRLLAELRTRAASLDVEWLHARGASYGAGIPYLPVQALARQLLRLTERDDVVRHLLGVSGEGDSAALSPEAIKTRLFDALLKLHLERARETTLVVVVEDLHWVDRSSESWLTLLAEHAGRASILFVVTYRPGYRPPWMSRSDATEIALPPLGPDDARAVIDTLLAPDVRELGDRILERAEGNPFFLEELARGLGAHDGAAMNVVPVTVQDVLQARIDRIPAEPRRLLDAAAVYGRAVPAAVLRAMWDGPGAPDVHVRELARLELLYDEGRGETTTHVFRHALLQDVAYQALPRERREALHRTAATALETVYADRLDDLIARLAYHWSRGAVADKAADYLSRLAERAARVYSHAEEIAALQEALTHVERSTSSDRDRQALGLVLRHAHSLNTMGGLADAVKLLGEHRERVERLGDPALTGAYHFRLAHNWSLMGDPQLTVAHGRLALAEATRAGDQTTIGQALYVLAYECFWSGRPAEGAALARQAIERLDRVEDGYWLGHAWWVLSINHMQVGALPAALEAVQRFVAIGTAREDARLLSLATASLGACYVLMGDWDLGIAACLEGRRRALDPVGAAAAAGFLGAAHLEQGDPAQAVAPLEEAVALYTQVGVRQTAAWFTGLLAEARALTGSAVDAPALAEKALDTVIALQYAYGIAITERSLGRIALATGRLADAGRWFARALTTCTRMGASYDVARVHLDLARLANAERRHDRVVTSLREALGRFETLGVPRYADITRKLAVELGVGPLL